MRDTKKWSKYLDVNAFIDALPSASDEELKAVFRCIVRSFDHLEPLSQDYDGLGNDCCGDDGWNVFGIIKNAIGDELYKRIPEHETLLGILKKREADAFAAGVAHA